MRNKIDFGDVLEYYRISEEDSYFFALKHDLLLEYSIANGEGDSFRNEIRENWPKFLGEYYYDDIVIQYIENKLLYTKLAFGKQFHLIKRNHFLLLLLTSVNVKLQINYTNDNLLSTLKYLTINNMNLGNLSISKYDFTKEVDWRIARYFGKDAIAIDEDAKKIVASYKQELQFLHDCISEELEERFKSNTATENAVVKEDEQITNLKRQFEAVIQNKNEEIDLLKDTLISNKSSSQQDMIYAARQYDKAIENVIIGLTENKFGNVLDKLYDYNIDSKQDEINNILTNLFFVLKTLGIEAYQEELIQKKVKFNKEDLGKTYRVISGTTESYQGEAVIKYPGWKLKDRVIVLPGIAVL